MTKIFQFKQHLSELEQMMRKHGLWSQSSPPAEALASQQPFALDTLAPEAWLQWVFIPRMLELIQAEQPLPSGFAIAPYFAQVWSQDKAKQVLLPLLETIDKVCE
jgi:uncharacterized protein YqcC (DUF446 family)